MSADARLRNEIQFDPTIFSRVGVVIVIKWDELTRSIQAGLPVGQREGEKPRYGRNDICVRDISQRSMYGRIRRPVAAGGRPRYG
jgi:hypothetical protein